MSESKSYRALLRALSLLILLCFVVGLLFALSHHCGGEDCPLCLLNGGRKAFLQLFGGCMLLLLCKEAGAGMTCNPSFWVSLRTENLVMQKVKLSN